jgi:hypothetical protein
MVVRDVLDALDLAARTIASTKQVIAAVNDGRRYLEQYHPAAKPDLAAMLNEMRLTVRGLAKVSKVVTHFQFTVAGAATDLEPVRFNNYVIESKEDLQELEDHISDLKGSCTKIEEHLQALNQRGGGRWNDWVGLLGERKEARRIELTQALQDAYTIDESMIYVIRTLTDAARTTLEDVSKALGSATSALPENVPAAAELLRERAEGFRRVERECIDYAAQLRQHVDALR